MLESNEGSETSLFDGLVAVFGVAHWQWGMEHTLVFGLGLI